MLLYLLELMSSLARLVDVDLGALLLLKGPMVLIEHKEEGTDILEEHAGYLNYLEGLLVVEQVFNQLKKLISEDSQTAMKQRGKHKTAKIDHLGPSELPFLRIEGCLLLPWITIHALSHDIYQSMYRREDQQRFRPEDKGLRDLSILSKAHVTHQRKAILILKFQYGINLVDNSRKDGRNYDSTHEVVELKYPRQFIFLLVFLLLLFLWVMDHQH